MLLSLPALPWSKDLGAGPASHLRAAVCVQCRWVCPGQIPYFSKLLLWVGSQGCSGQLKTACLCPASGLDYGQALVWAECRLSGKELLFIPVSILKEIREQDDVNDGCLGLGIAWQEIWQFWITKQVNKNFPIKRAEKWIRETLFMFLWKLSRGKI